MLSRSMTADCIMSNRDLSMSENNIIPLKETSITPLVDDLRQIINQTRNRVAANVNAELTIMYWHIGERINRDVLGNQRAEYGANCRAVGAKIVFPSARAKIS